MNLPGLPHLNTYRVILADPPWEHNNYGQAKHGSYRESYDGLSIERLAAMPVGALAHQEGAVLLLWCTGAMAADGAHKRIADAWGFRLATRAFSWVKVAEKCAGCDHRWDEHDESLVTEDAPGLCSARSATGCGCEQFVVRARRGPGSYTMQGVEDVWLGIKGEGFSAARDERDVPEIVFAPLQRDETGKPAHSKKPETVQARVERLWPESTPRLELFARRRRDGWAAWGNEAPECDLVFGATIGTTWPAEAPKEKVGRW